MGYRLLLLVITITGCGLEDLVTQELPVHVWIDGSFSPAEKNAIQQAINTANQQFGQQLLGEDVIIVEGPATDTDGFTDTDLLDDQHIIYRVGEPDLFYQYLLECYDDLDSISGYGTQADIVLFTFVLAENSTPEIPYLVSLQSTALHELGHLLGIGHNPCPESVMYPLTGDEISYTLCDLQAFCFAYQCENPPDY